MTHALHSIPLNNDSEVQAAYIFALKAHGTQTRKYTGDPYIVHPVEVAAMVSRVDHTKEMVIAALLHDVVEDTPVTIEEIHHLFGGGVGDLVFDLTDVSKPEDGNRAARKAKDREHLRRASVDAKTIKLADLINNTRSIVEYDADFARVYLKEKIALLGVLLEGNAVLWDQAAYEVKKGAAKLGLNLETLDEVHLPYAGVR